MIRGLLVNYKIRQTYESEHIPYIKDTVWNAAVTTTCQKHFKLLYISPLKNPSKQWLDLTKSLKHDSKLTKRSHKKN